MVVALIPCRSQSKRIPNKNIALLNGHPLLAYSICSALDSEIFDKVVVSTDSTNYAGIAEKYGAEVIMRPPEFATDTSPDYEWVKYTIDCLAERGKEYDAFSILRPTSPFRTVETIKRAFEQFDDSCDSIRAVELCSQHPYKMWILKGKFIEPLMETDMHSKPYQLLPHVYVQNASLEIAWTYVIYTIGNISGNIVKPFFTQGYEGVDINVPYDLKYVEWLVETGQAKLPDVRTKH